jgi:hypothetical protein
MDLERTNPRHQPETRFNGEIQVFEGPALSPNDPSIEPRIRKGRPNVPTRRSEADTTDPPPTM